MNTYQFIASLVASGAWPVSAIALAILLRRPVIGLLERTESAEGWGAKFKFAKRVADLEDRTEQLPLPPSDAEPLEPLQLPAPPDHQSLAFLEVSEELSSSTAVGSVIASWVGLESSLKRIADAKGFATTSSNTSRMILDLLAIGVLSPESADIIRGLRDLRNQVAHGRKTDVSLADAARYRETVKKMIESLAATSSYKTYK